MNSYVVVYSIYDVTKLNNFSCKTLIVTVITSISCSHTLSTDAHGYSCNIECMQLVLSKRTTQSS